MSRCNLRLQKRLAAAVRKCGKKKVWLDPNEITEISNSTSRQSIRHLIRDGVIIHRPVGIHTKFRVRKYKEARLKGRHCGFGKRKGTSEARNSVKALWTQRMHVLRRLLKKYRNNKKIDKHMHAKLYRQIKGNMFKNKCVLMEYIFKKKAEITRKKLWFDQSEAHRHRARHIRMQRERKIAHRKMLAEAAQD